MARIALAAVTWSAISAGAAEIAVLSAAAVQVPLEQVARQFERDSGHRVSMEFVTAGQVEERLAAGARPDVVINTSARIRERNTNTSDAVVRDLGTVKIGVAARAGARRPDLSSVAAFRESLLRAQTVAYGDPARGATTGIHFAKLIDRLGLREALAGKSVLAANGLEVMRAVSRGQAELGITQTSEIMHIDPSTYIGPLPPELQLATTYTAWLRDAANAPATALVDALTSATGRERFRAAGFE